MIIKGRIDVFWSIVLLEITNEMQSKANEMNQTTLRHLNCFRKTFAVIQRYSSLGGCGFALWLGWVAQSVSPVNHTDISQLWKTMNHVCGRRWIAVSSKCVMLSCDVT